LPFMVYMDEFHSFTTRSSGRARCFPSFASSGSV
jgi:hypothetical protein